MPPILAAAAEAAAVSVGTTTIGALVADAAISMALSFAANSLLGGRPPQPASYSAQVHDLTHTFRSASAPHVIPLGSVRVSGPLYPVGSTGKNNDYLHLIVPLAGCQIASIGEIYINGEALTGSKMEKLVRVNKHLGDQTAADSDLVAEISEWASTQVGKGIAYVYLRCKYDANAFPSGINNVQADIEGRPLYDPRTLATSFNNNWANAVRDYITADFGPGWASSEVDDTYFIAAANTSDEAVALSTGGTEARYTVDGCYTLDRTPRDIITSLLTAGGGTLVPLVEGMARLIPAAYTAPAVALTESDLRADVEYDPISPLKDVYNVVFGMYAGIETNWQPINYPQVGNATYIADDNGVEKRQQLDFPFCATHERCQRLASIYLKRARNGGIMHFPAKLTPLQIATMDIVGVTLSDLGFANEPFRVVGWKLNEDFSIDLVMHHDASADYAWSTADVSAFTPDTTGINLPIGPAYTDLSGVTVRGLQIDGQGNGTSFTGKHCKVVWRNFTARNFQELGAEVFGAGTGTKFEDWFAAYEVTILDGSGSSVRVERLMTNSYVYTYEKNVEDNGTALRSFTVQVRMLGNQGQRTSPAAITVSNPSPALPLNTRVQGTFGGIAIAFDWPTDLDRSGAIAWISSTSGYTPSAATIAYDGPDSSIEIKALADGTPLLAGVTYYVHIGVYDAFGTTGMAISSELAATTSMIENSQIGDASIEAIKLAASVGDFWAIHVNADGQAVGMSIISGGSTGSPSAVTFVADQLALADPADPTNTAVPFVVNAGGSAHFGGTVDAANLLAGTITATLDLNAANIWGGQIAIGSNFAVDTAGNMVAANASLSGSLTVTGAVSAGQSAYDTGAGFWLEGGATPRLSIGDPSSSYLTYDGTTLSINGDINPLYKTGSIQYASSTTSHSAPSATATSSGAPAGPNYSAWTLAQEIVVPGAGALSFSIDFSVYVVGDGYPTIPAGTVLAQVAIYVNGVLKNGPFDVTGYNNSATNGPWTWTNTASGTVTVTNGDSVQVYVRSVAYVSGYSDGTVGSGGITTTGTSASLTLFADKYYNVGVIR